MTEFVVKRLMVHEKNKNKITVKNANFKAIAIALAVSLQNEWLKIN
jgi:hypothetical protein